MTIKLTKEEIKNGWTPEKLEAYRKNRDEAAHESVFKERNPKPSSQKRYNPHRWRE